MARAPKFSAPRQKDPSRKEKTWLSQLGQVAPVAQWLEKEVFVGNEGTRSAGRVCLPACLFLFFLVFSPRDPVPSSSSSSVRGMCAVVVVGWAPPPAPTPSLPGQFALHLSAPNNSPHFTAVPSLDGHARNTGL